MNEKKAPAARALAKKQIKIIINCFVHQKTHSMNETKGPAARAMAKNKKNNMKKRFLH